jgi:predicted O-linked N-acetylglucosamine transferase (SPINDLY family)
MTTPTEPGRLATDPLLAIRDQLLRGDFAGAAFWLDGHTAAQPDDARAFGLLGKCRRETREFAAAERALLRSLQLAPDLLPSRRELALLRRDQGDLEGAAEALRALLTGAPSDASLWWELALLQAPTAPELALQSIERLRQLRPEDVEPALLMAQLLLRTGRHAEAEAGAGWILQRQPQRIEALEIAYWSLVERSIESAQRLTLAQRIVALAPSGERLLALSHDLYGAGDFAAGHAAIEAACVREPRLLAARWARFQLPRSPAPQNAAEQAAFCDQWRQGLAEFEALDFRQPALAAQVWGCVGQSTAFYRHYIDDAVADQRRYGALLGRMMQALDPGISPRPLRPLRRRIGFCGAYFRAHTVTRLFAPLIEALAEHDFELEVFALAGTGDGWGERLRRVARVHDQPRRAAEWRALIAERELDVLVYTEIGMHPLAQGLAAIRLAPVQATLWGHPVTTGLASIDHVLSPDAMEPADGQAFYSERLLRLPGLGHGLLMAEQPIAQAVALDAPDPARIDLLCAQTVYKLLPEQDELFGRILARLPQARLHLLADDRAAVRDWLQARMTPTLRACGADPERQLRIHGFLPLPQFLGLASACRLNLDSIGWSGGMSALDLLGEGLPTLTLEGRSMRTRQTAALLQRLDVSELIAENPDEYVEKAVALAGDDHRLQHLRQRILAARHRLFADPSTLAALADFLATVEAPEPR